MKTVFPYSIIILLLLSCCGKSDTRLYLESVNSVAVNLKDSVYFNDENDTLINASKVYYKSKKYDTTYYLIREVIRNESLNINNKLEAYQIIMNPEIRNLIPRDTLLLYYEEYNRILKGCLDELHGMLESNSDVYVRLVKQTEASRDEMKVWVLILVTVLSIFITVALILALRENKHIAEIRKAQLYIDELKSMSYRFNKYDEESKSTVKINTELIDCGESALEKMRNELILMSENGDLVDSMSDFKSTEIYLMLCQKIEDNRVVVENKEIMNKVKTTIQLKSPEFKNNLLVLSQGKLTEIDRNTCMLIKLGFKPAQLAILLGITKGSVSSRREGIGIKILGEKTPVGIVDKIVKLL
ncbi:MAG: hypothetical protein HDS83_04330 [Bacteroidales bacterium]|nr:hypothetical protein [Bacteroidales bacterium]